MSDQIEVINIQEEVQSLEPSAKIELFVLDTTMFENGEVWYFHSGVSQVNRPLVWQGITYQPMPIQATGFDLTTQGTLPRPIFKIANPDGIISSIVMKMDDLTGAKVTRKRTFARYLDAVNFPNGENPTANPDQYLPDQFWKIDRKKVETRYQVEFELASSFDFDGIKLPLRQIIKNTCTWRYRSSECGYTGVYMDINDNETGDANKDTCGRRFSSCKARCGEKMNMEALPFGGFVGAERGD